jgi:hypothetical protein
MFARVKKSGRYEYLQIVHNLRVDGHVRQQVLATLGRLDLLKETGQLDALLASCAKFSEHAAVLNAARQDNLQTGHAVRLGPPLVFGRLWQELGVPQVLESLLRGRKFDFSVERAVFLTVLHRLMVSGSDRAAERWCRRYAIDGIEALELQHLYRAMGWLGEPLPMDEQPTDQRLGPRCRKERVEELLFAHRRDLFSGLQVAFFDTTSLYFEGAGGETLGQHGYSKDHRPDLKQMVVGVVLDERGWPLCCFLLPGNTADITMLVPVVDQLRARFGIERLCVVADRGLISAETIRQLEERKWEYILGARLRSVKEIREEVLSRAGRYHVVQGPRENSKDPSPLKVKEVYVDERRYIVCHNEEQATKDRHDREAILQKLADQLAHGPKSLVGNKGFRKYLQVDGEFVIDTDKVAAEERFDGKWVLRTNTQLTASEVALRYKDLLHVESMFRSLKSLLDTRPIYHRCDDTIRGHVFCSFLALLMMKELQSRLESRDWGDVEWRRLLDELDDLQELTITANGKSYAVRTAPRGDAGKAIQAAGVALGPAIRSA